MKLEKSKNVSRIARGVMRHFAQIGLSSLSEFSPTNGLRVDIITLGIFGAGINTQKYAYDKLKKLIDHNVVIYNSMIL